MLFGIGTDLIEINRIEEAVAKTGDRFLQRVYTPEERKYCLSKRDPYPCLAARFAAKEAVLKALGTGLTGSRWTDVEIVVSDGGKPEVTLRGGAARTATREGIKRILVSISHGHSHAVAFATAES